jgi:hypothetical protein
MTGSFMGRVQKHSPERIVSLLGQIEETVANGKTAAQGGWPTLCFRVKLPQGWVVGKGSTRTQGAPPAPPAGGMGIMSPDFL